ncbi:MAG: hypothetical protein B5M54_06265 [Candidatus Aminicenantes bacterium 4484_214]|nr:MAG: hypothetical protein B5M54_06265 [Candidatus Aminicenantes bacterium 4484_214]HDJ23615.1 hypothetical protein [Candidatus Aminicenantes bacterium]
MRKDGCYEQERIFPNLLREENPNKIMPRRQALFLALSDPIISQWLRTRFSPPEKSPLVTVDLELVHLSFQSLWKAEIKEQGRRNPFSLAIIVVWLEACSGQIIERKIYSWLKRDELDELISQQRSAFSLLNYKDRNR